MEIAFGVRSARDCQTNQGERAFRIEADHPPNQIALHPREKRKRDNTMNVASLICVLVILLFRFDSTGQITPRQKILNFLKYRSSDA
jgi:hypothetical protein